MSAPGSALSPSIASHPREPRPLRICHLGKFYPPASGGMEAHVRTLAQAQAALGAEVEVVCVNHLGEAGLDLTHVASGRTPTVVERDGAVTVHRLGKWGSLARFELCPELLPTLGELRRRQVDVLHLHAPNPAMLVALLARRPFGALVITHHSDVVRQRLLGAAFRPLERRGFARAARVFATSAAYAEASAPLRELGAKVEVLPLGIELQPFEQPSAEARAFAASLGAARPRWLMVGRLVYYKGHQTALEALRELPGELVVIGRGPLERELRAKAEALGVAARVRFLGERSDAEVQGAYRAATALWFCGNARSEAFGLSQVEAMAAGLPVVNTEIPGSGVAWVSPHEQSGLTVPVGDARALAAASRRLLDEPGLAERLGARRAAAGPGAVLERGDGHARARALSRGARRGAAPTELERREEQAG